MIPAVKIEIVLKDGLIRYHPSLKAGTKGIIVSLYAAHDCFARVQFQEAGVRYLVEGNRNY